MFVFTNYDNLFREEAFNPSLGEIEVPLTESDLPEFWRQVHAVLDMDLVIYDAFTPPESLEVKDFPPGLPVESCKFNWTNLAHFKPIATHGSDILLQNPGIAVVSSMLPFTSFWVFLSAAHIGCEFFKFSEATALSFDSMASLKAYCESSFASWKNL